MLLSQAATPIVAALPAIPPSHTMPYTGGKTTGAIRASLQRALDNYKTGHINLPHQVSEFDLSRSDTRSFGESHASELSSIDPEASSLSAAHATPLSSANPLPSVSTQNIPPIDVTTLNNSPAPIPTPVPAVDTISDPVNPAQTLPAVTPTIAETGLPVTSGYMSPGPSSGSLLDIRGQGSATSATDVGSQKYESAEEEKKRLAAAYLQKASAGVQELSPAAAAAPTPRFESAEEEKKRLEREERERILRGSNPPSKGNDEDLPPYEGPSL